MSKSLFVQLRDWLEGKFHYIIEFMTPTENALADAIPEDLLPQVEQIATDAVKAAEANGGSSGAKFDAAVAVVVPALEVLGVTLAKAVLQIFISNIVVKLGYSKST